MQALTTLVPFLGVSAALQRMEGGARTACVRAQVAQVGDLALTRGRPRRQRRGHERRYRPLRGGPHSEA